MALHTETAIYKATYQLAQLVMQLVANMPRNYKADFGAELRRRCMGLVMRTYEANTSQDKSPILSKMRQEVEARIEALEKILDIQNRISMASRLNIDLINHEEEYRIRELIAADTWPNGWDGDEPHADDFMPVIFYENGAEQHDLFGEVA